MMVKPAATGRFDDTVAKPTFKGKGVLPPLLAEKNSLVCPPASENVLLGALAIMSKSATFIGVPLSLVSVIVPVAAGLPGGAGLVIPITVAQTTLVRFTVPSKNSGKYKSDCAEDTATPHNMNA